MLGWCKYIRSKPWWFSVCSRQAVLLVAVCWLFIGGGLEAQIVIHDLGRETKRDSLVKMFQAIHEHRSTLPASQIRKQHRTDVFKLDSMTVIVHEGRLDVFRWQADSFRNISNSVYHGYNFRSKKFVYHDTLYSIGGYGFWRNNADLTYFNPSLREWSILPSKKEFSGVQAGQILQFDDEIIALAPVTRIQGAGDTHQNTDIYSYRLGDRKWEHLTSQSTYIPSLSVNKIETEHYALYLHSTRTLVHKPTLTYVQSDVLTPPGISSKFIHRYHFFLTGDSLYAWNNEFELVATYDLNQMFHDSNLASQPLVVAQSTRSTKTLWMSGGLVLLLLSMGIALVRKRKMRHQTDPGHPQIEAVLNYNKRVLTKAELDQLLEISYIQSDSSLRVKRSKLIQDINNSYNKSHGTDLIVRRANPEDKRENLYFVEE